jgi:hypothetical protein
MSEWVQQAKRMRESGHTWKTIAAVTGRTIFQVRYAVDPRYEAQIREKSQRKYYQNREAILEALKWRRRSAKAEVRA